MSEKEALEEKNNNSPRPLDEEIEAIRWESVGQSAMDISELAFNHEKSRMEVLRMAEETLYKKIENANKHAPSKLDLASFLLLPLVLLVASLSFVDRQWAMFLVYFIPAIILTMSVVFYWKTPPPSGKPFTRECGGGLAP